MSIGILGQKVGMTRVYDDAGIITPVTVILAEPNAVLQVKTIENDGYKAVQVGVFDQKEHRVTKPELGHFKKSGADAEEVRARVRSSTRRKRRPPRRSTSTASRSARSSTSSASPRARASRAR